MFYELFKCFLSLHYNGIERATRLGSPQFVMVGNPCSITYIIPVTVYPVKISLRVKEHPGWTD